ncbi:acyltransferase [Cryptosporangium sp. NPDC051539]|uniref:acyltransferase n=1 Tax=Cryptosporangium sp. NPDC051539 TaxID=3363962 RepID=UPI0037AB5DB7
MNLPAVTDQPRVTHRDRYLDALRAAALVRVTVFHAFGWLWLKWLPSMGIMFAIGGSLMARSMSRSPRRAVGTRVRRLLPVLWAFGLIWVPVMIWHDGPPGDWVTPDGSPIDPWQLLFWILPIGNPVGSGWGVVGWGVLWYVKTYLLFVVLSPVLLPAFRRAPGPTVAAPFLLLTLGELDVVPLAGWWGNSINDVLTYLGCWLIGFAHADGQLRRASPAKLLTLGGVIALAGIAWLAGVARSSSLLDSDLAIALYYFGTVLILMRFSFRLEWLDRVPWLDRAISVINARAVTIFLWHGVALLIASTWLGGSPLIWFPAAWVLIGVAVVLFGWLEDLAARRRPRLVPLRP